MGNCQAVNDITVPASFEGIMLNCRSWKKTYSNLYDYTAQSSQYSQQNFTASLLPGQSCMLFKKGEQASLTAPISASASSSSPTPEQQIQMENSIIKLTNKNGMYFVEPSLNVQKLTAYQVWLAVKSTPSHKYKLKEGDIIRIGNQKVKVKEIILEDSQSQSAIQVKSIYKVYQNMNKQNSTGYNPPQDTQQPICRVCLQQGQPNNPLLSPCKCSGSSKFIHIKCIQEWFNKIINPHKINSSLIITWKPLICQLCNESLPFKIYIDGVKHFTVNIPRPEKPYLVLNPIMKEKSSSKVYFLVSFCEKRVLTIGRKKDSDVVLDQDSSISRCHSCISYEEGKDKKNGRFVLSDKDSKFGTLVLLKKPINLSNIHKPLTLQFGGSTITMLTRGKQSENQGDEQQINESQKSTSTESVNNEQNVQETG